MKKRYLLLFCLSFLCSHKIWADVGSIQIRLNENMQVVDLATSSVSTPTIDEAFVQQGGLTTAEENQCTVNADGTVQEAECTCPDGGTLTPHGNQYVCCKDKKIYDGEDYSSYFMPTCGCPEGYRLPWGNVSKENLCCKNGQNCYTVLGGTEICDDSDDCGCPDGSKGYENVCCDDEGKVLTAMETSTQNYTLCGCAIDNPDLRNENCKTQVKCEKTQGMEWCEGGVCMPKDTCPCVPGSETSACTEQDCTTQNGCWYDGTCYQKQESCGEGGRSWNDNVCSCTCPENEHWNDTTNQCEECVQNADCPGGKECESNTCVCPEDKPKWNDTQCEPCPEDTPKWDGEQCEACPSEEPFWDGNDCVTCATVDEATPVWNGEACVECTEEKDGLCEGDQICDTELYTCVCPNTAKVWTGTTCVQCTEDDHCEGNQICKTDYTCGCANANANGTACWECYGDFGAEEWPCSEEKPVCDGYDHTCKACPEDTPVWKVIEEKGQCVSCAVADLRNPVWNATSQECEPCPEDTPKWDGEQCEACPANSEWSDDQCQCKTGYTLKDDGTCQPCAKGTYKFSAGNTPCDACPANKTTTDKGATAITDCVCPSGQRWNDSECVDPPANSEWSGDQYLCNAGYTLKDDDTCQACDKGTYKFSAGNTPCDACPEGSYQDKTGQTQCIDCSGGRTTANTGATASTECVCPSGQNWNGTTCGACPADKPAWDATSKECVTCATVDSKKPFWDVENGVCVAGCNTTMKQTDNTCQCDKTKDPEDPSKNSKTPVWDAWRNRCVSCFRYNEKTPVWNGTTCEPCPAETPVWDLYNEKCVKCYDSISANWTDLGCGGTVDHSSYNPRQNKWSSGEVIEPRVCKVDADNTNNNTCVQCTEHSHCPGATPKCENNSCSECPSEEPFWDGNACVTCADNNSDTPVWNATKKECVSCADNNSDTPVWNATKKECVSCAVADSKRPVWNATSKTCVPCVSVDQNKPAWNDTKKECATCAEADSTNPVWNATSKECEPCPEDTPIWKNGECIACPNNQKWNEEKEACVQCTDDTHCRAGQYCNNGSCANCTKGKKCRCTYCSNGSGGCQTAEQWCTWKHGKNFDSVNDDNQCQNSTCSSSKKGSPWSCSYKEGSGCDNQHGGTGDNQGYNCYQYKALETTCSN